MTKEEQYRLAIFGMLAMQTMSTELGKRMTINEVYKKAYDELNGFLDTCDYKYLKHKYELVQQLTK